MSSLNIKQNGVPLDLEAARRELAGEAGRSYWRGLEELAGHPQFEELLHREFPVQADEWANPVTRRSFLSLMGASLALAGLAGCSQPPPEKILPYVRQPEDIVPGKPLFFASVMPLAGIGAGVLVESHMGRPTKIEGNPEHPASLGSTDAFTQASVLNLYDPDRETGITHLGRASTWNEALTALRAALRRQAPNRGRGFRILTEAISSPSQIGLLERLLKDFPEARWHQFEPAVGDGALEGANLAFGKPVQAIYHVGKADVIVAIDSDFLSMEPGSVRYSREFSERRRPGGQGFNRLYALESSPSTTGCVADHRLPARPSEIDALAVLLANKLGVEGIEAPTNASSNQQRWIEAVARDLKSRKPGTTLVVCGTGQSAPAHALVHAMNERLGNRGHTVVYIAPVTGRPEKRLASLDELTGAMAAGEVDTLLILGGNPVYTAPGTDFRDAMAKVRLRAHLGMYADESSELCHWHIPEAHYLECWSDIRAFEGTASIGQPLIAPLFGAKSPLELLSGLIDETPSGSYEVVRATWRRWHGDHKISGEFEHFWRRSVHAGVIAGTQSAAESVRLAPGLARRMPAPPSTAGKDLEIVFKPDPGVFDGRFANNGWLQELPRPLTKLTWDNAACISPTTAKTLGLSYAFGATAGEHGRAYADVVTLELRGRTLELPIWIVPGHADDCVTVNMGFGRTRAGRVGDHVGARAASLQTSANFWSAGGVRLFKTGRCHLLACVQGHHSMEGRGLVRGATVAEFAKDPDFATRPDQEPRAHGPEGGHEEPNGRRPLSMLPPYPYEGYKWGMVIDLGACTGCSACVVACQAENNIPVVGKEEVSRGREMHWIRVDRYYQGDPFADPDKLITRHQPVPCMQCENAPCELVCPVAATSHSQDGLNDMVYNRCVGTRYCSNNCPYKVRRFNFLQYADYVTPSLRLLYNPEVTVRSRGVMEKCTYCVQRIRGAEIEAEKHQRRIRDGEVVTACQAACPAQAILFGDMNDPKSKIAQAKKSPLNYSLLHELNTQPRTTYRAALRNPNPELA